MSESEREAAWERIDEITASWDNPREGAVAIELWTYHGGVAGPDVPMGYILMPLFGPWDVELRNNPSGFMERLNSAHIFPEFFFVNVYESGMWNRKVMWHKKGGVKWLS